MTYDVDAVRACFPALLEGAAHFDGPGGTQVPVQVAEVVASTLTSAVANRGSVTRAERRADAIVVEARQAVADLVGGVPEGVVFGRSMTALTYQFARTLAAGWGPGDEVVVTRLDHDANVRPWVQAAHAVGAAVRWVAFDRATAELPADAVTRLLSERTRLVAVTGASNLLGTRPDIVAITSVAHDAGALVHVDGVHLTPHAPVDVVQLGADLYTCSPYKFLGPHLGALTADPSLLGTLRPEKLAASTDDVPERFELGTLPYELLAGTTAAVDVLAGLVAADGSRRQRLATSMAALESYETERSRQLDTGLADIGGVVIHSRAGQRTPTTLFSVDGLAPERVAEHLAAAGVNAPAGHFYAIEASRWLGLGDRGAVRAGIAPYTDANDVDRLLEGVAEIAATIERGP